MPSVGQSFHLIAPFPPEYYSKVWEWMLEKPEANLDDSGPKSLADLRKQFKWQVEHGVTFTAVIVNNQPVGLIGYVKKTKDLSWFKGIVFSSQVHHTPITRDSVGQFLAEKFDAGAKSVHAQVFDSNAIIQRFLARFGAETCNFLPRGTMQCGKPIDVRELVLTSENFYRAMYRSGLGASHLSCMA